MPSTASWIATNTVAKRRPAVFLDRDGVVNVDRGYVGRIDEFTLVEGAAQAISLLNRHEYLVFVVTNQSGVARGYFTAKDYRLVTEYMNSLLAEQGAHIDDIRHCFFHPEATISRYRAPHPWRKPAPGMILDLLRTWNVAEQASFMIGDSVRDVQSANAAGIRGYLFDGGNLLHFLKRIQPELNQD